MNTEEAHKWVAASVLTLSSLSKPSFHRSPSSGVPRAPTLGTRHCPNGNQLAGMVASRSRLLARSRASFAATTTRT